MATFWGYVKQRVNTYRVAYSRVDVDGWSKAGDGPKAYHVALIAASGKRVGQIELTMEMIEQITRHIKEAP